MTWHAEDAAGLQRVALEAEESVQYGYLEAAAEPFERQVQLEAPFGAVPRENGERFRDGIREDKLKFYRAKVRGQERVFEDMAIDVWTSPDGAAVVGVRRQEVAELAAAPAVKEDITINFTDFQVAAEVVQMNSELQEVNGQTGGRRGRTTTEDLQVSSAPVSRNSELYGASGDAGGDEGRIDTLDWQSTSLGMVPYSGRVVGSPVLALRSMGRRSASDDKANMQQQRQPVAAEGTAVQRAASEVVAVQPVAAVGTAVQFSASEVAAGQPGAADVQPVAAKGGAVQLAAAHGTAGQLGASEVAGVQSVAAVGAAGEPFAAEGAAVQPVAAGLAPGQPVAADEAAVQPGAEVSSRPPRRATACASAGEKRGVPCRDHRFPRRQRKRA